jgi:hypothetical protein
MFLNFDEQYINRPKQRGKMKKTLGFEQKIVEVSQLSQHRPGVSGVSVRKDPDRSSCLNMTLEG